MNWFAATRFAVLPVASLGASWIAVVAVSFLLIRLVPGDPVENLHQSYERSCNG